MHPTDASCYFVDPVFAKEAWEDFKTAPKTPPTTQSTPSTTSRTSTIARSYLSAAKSSAESALAKLRREAKCLWLRKRYLCMSRAEKDYVEEVAYKL